MFNNVSGKWATANGGVDNIASGTAATVVGGRSNTAGGPGAFVGGGGYDGTYIGGNRALGVASTIGGGLGNTITSSGRYATIPGGMSNRAKGAYSFAAGKGAKALYDGCFVWGDASTIWQNVSCWGPNRVVFRSVGGFYIYTSVDLTTGMYLPGGGGSWNSLSDLNAKENVEPVNPLKVLDKLARMPVNTWNYKTQDASIRHMGPMAQDFYAAFGLGEGDTHIGTLDAEGVSMAVIKGLYMQNQDQARRIAELESQNAELMFRLQAIEVQIEELKTQCERSGK